MSNPLFENGWIKDKLMVVSNREPYIHRKTGDSTKVERPAGGLTSALDDVLSSLGGLWVAWGSGSADRNTVDKRDCLKVPPDHPAYTLKRVWLHPRLVENYYNGYSNQVLWPLCHITLDRVYYRKKFWEAYQRVNLAFAEAVLEEVISYPAVWIHDYHLCLLPGLLREKAPHLTLAHFWHIPWPDWSVFRICPQAREILEGLLGNDMIGFQIPLFGKNFMDCARECLGAELEEDPPAITYQGRRTLIKTFSIGIDYEKFNQLAASPRTTHLMSRLREKHRFSIFLGLGVDRLDYTKALLKRLQAIDLFFEKNRRYKSKVSFFQVAIPTRMQEPYISYKAAVEQLIEKINSKYAQGDWEPIVYVDRKIEHSDLAAYYRMADFAVISSVYDGMNLVAKEFVASQVDEKGVLILSELAGAAESLDGALLVNPYDLEDFSDNIKKALRMPEWEKKGRMRTLRTQVQEENVYKWIQDILQEISFLASSKTRDDKYLFNRLSDLRSQIKDRPLALFLDYDGTLTPIMETPDQAVLSSETRMLLSNLKELARLIIISGRGLEELQNLVRIPGLLYVGNHGAEIRDGNTISITQNPSSDLNILKEFITDLKESLAPLPGFFLEEKGITASVHFRQVPASQLGSFFDLFWRTAGFYKGHFRITKGKKVFEIRPLTSWNKGDALKLILGTLSPQGFSIYIGDDTTDEDAYKVLRGKGISISVGRNPNSDYHFYQQGEVDIFLERLTSLIKADHS